MAREIVSLHPSDGCEDALRYLLSLNIHAAPVIDSDRRPLGTLSLADLLGDLARARVADRMSTPARSVSASATIATAQAAMVDAGFHHLPATDELGKVVGFVSALDLLRAALGRGQPAASPTPFLDPARELQWTEPQWLSRGELDAAPQGPGYLLVLADDAIVCAESCHDVRRRARELLDHPSDRFTLYLDGGPLKFRIAPLGPGAHRLLGARG